VRHSRIGLVTKPDPHQRDRLIAEGPTPTGLLLTELPQDPHTQFPLCGVAVAYERGSAVDGIGTSLSSSSISRLANRSNNSSGSSSGTGTSTSLTPSSLPRQRPGFHQGHHGINGCYLKRSISNLAVNGVDHLLAIIKNQLKSIQYRTDLPDSFLTHTGLTRCCRYAS
jgi:hypothetical protein